MRFGLLRIYRIFMHIAAILIAIIGLALFINIAFIGVQIEGFEGIFVGAGAVYCIGALIYAMGISAAAEVIGVLLSIEESAFQLYRESQRAEREARKEAPQVDYYNRWKKN